MRRFNRIGIPACLLIMAVLAPGLAVSMPVVWWQAGDDPLQYATGWQNASDGSFSFFFGGQSEGYTVQGRMVVNQDPFIAWGLSVINNTDNPMNFSTGVIDNNFITPLVGPNVVFGSFSGSVTDIFGDGVTVAPINAKIQTTTLDLTTNMGVDVGDFYHHGAGLPGASYVMLPDEKGPMPGPQGAWTSMNLQAEFSLSKHDVATVNGFASIEPVPEPRTIMLLGSGLLALAFWTRRKSH